MEAPVSDGGEIIAVFAGLENGPLDDDALNTQAIRRS